MPLSVVFIYSELSDFVKGAHKADAVMTLSTGTYDCLEINTFQRSGHPTEAEKPCIVDP